MQIHKPNTGFNAAIFMSKVGDRISCSPNNTIDGSIALTFPMPL